jgi:choline dehydrogenase-like flavoprotein
MKKNMDQDWDVVIIGTGMGGSTLGYALAQKGKKVLFLERGLAYPSDQSIIGKSIESTLDRCRLLGGGDSLLHRRGGRYSRSLTDITHPNHPYSFIPFMGEGIGGSSSIYGAALERFFPEDFQATRFFSAVPGASVVDWHWLVHKSNVTNVVPPTNGFNCPILGYNISNNINIVRSKWAIDKTLIIVVSKYTRNKTTTSFIST